MLQVLGMLSAEARASRLSFNDIVKHLAQQDEAQSTFVSKKVCGDLGVCNRSSALLYVRFWAHGSTAHLLLRTAVNGLSLPGGTGRDIVPARQGTNRRADPHGTGLLSVIALAATSGMPHLYTACPVRLWGCGAYATVQ